MIKMPRVRSRGEVKQIAIYGKTKKWKTRSDGVRQRYTYKYRFEIRGKGKNLANAYKLILDKRLTPRQRYLKISASALNRRWRNYAYEDEERREIGEEYEGKRRSRTGRGRWIFGR